MRLQPAASRISLTALALLLSALTAFAVESAPAAEKAPESAPITPNPPAAGLAEKPAETPVHHFPSIISIRFVGNENFSTRSLKRDLDTQANKPVDLKVLSADVDKISRKYEDDGFLEAKVNVTSEPLAGRTGQELLFTIVEGPRYKLTGVEIIGNDVFPTPELRALVQPEKDGYFSKQAFEDGAKRIWEHYGAVGRLTTVVLPKMAPQPGPAEAAVRYIIVEGPPVTLESVEVEWVNERVTEEWLVWRELNRKLHEGMDLTLDPIEDVMGRIRKHKWFKSVQYRVDAGATPDQAILVVSLEEGATSRVSVGGSAMSYSGFGANLMFQETDCDLSRPPHSWQDIWDWNMFRGRGERLILTAAPGQRFTTVGGSLEQPHTFGTDYSFLASAGYNREELPDFNLWQIQMRVGLGRDLSDHWSVSFGPTVEGTELWDLSNHGIPDYNAATGYTPGFGLWSRLTYSTTPETILINRGMYASLFVQPMYENTAFVDSTLSLARYFPIYGEGFKAHVLELSSEAGFLGGKAPVFDRFFLGGLGSVRGFDVWGISPQYQGAPIGGYWSISGSAEYSFPLVHVGDEAYFRGAVFVDYGDVETTPEELGRIRIGSGVGLRVVLPKAGGLTAGVNFAAPVNNYHGDSTLVFTFFMAMGV